MFDRLLASSVLFGSVRAEANEFKMIQSEKNDLIHMNIALLCTDILVHTVQLD